MHLASRLLAAALLAAALLAAACERVPNGDGRAEQALEPQRVPTAAETVSTTAAMPFNEALDGLVEARCEQERRCNNVGSGKRYDRPEACRVAVRTGFSDDIMPAHCPRAVDRRALAQCVKVVREEACGQDLDRLARIEPCRSQALCPP
ncbi:MAG: DUF6184 family natural product biosynthesis lipoprotein [Deltaproteobacteria bacterium]|nr:DUF6184 family natural product biosynthesis lipoprotein [Myxococcales bacterium]MDP3214167.1 DUF6184 family natural product biosynthesis lipoprotein [Deltaproteobacteria bacterium]